VKTAVALSGTPSLPVAATVYWPGSSDGATNVQLHVPVPEMG